jgi:uncharacterized protein
MANWAVKKETPPMTILMNRRELLASVCVLGFPLPQTRSAASAASADVTLSGTAYTPTHYPIEPAPFTDVKMKDTFWGPKIKTNAEVTIPFEMQKSAGTARPLNNNVLQAAIYSLQTFPDSRLQAQVDARIQAIQQSQGAKPSGDNSFFEVAAAHYAASGKRDLLDVASRTADSIYNAHKSAALPFSGGERDAINCIQLYRATTEKRYLDLAKHYLDIRGLPNSVNRSRHNQSHKPVLEQSEAVGHAVNDATLMLALAEVGTLTGIKDYFDAAHRIWLDAVSTKLYLTGGIGSTGNEGFGAAYSLPNLSAYAETCAGIMFATFNQRMFLATGDSRYIDVMERAMYNNVVDGVSVSGNRYFYVNRLASAGNGRDVRWEHASLECCPPNLVRFMASMPAYIYAQARTGDIYVNLYVSSDVSFKVNDKVLSLAVESEMPWGGRSRIAVATERAVNGSIKLRIPGWAGERPAPGGLYSYGERASKDTSVSINGKEVGHAVDESGYVSLTRDWRKGDVIEVEFPLEVRRVVADQKVRADRGRMGVERGPIVYCAEGPDCDGGHVLGLLFESNSELTPSVDRSFDGGVVVLRGEARNMSNPEAGRKPVKLIPYHLWANREAAEMSVWLPTAEYRVGDTGPAGGIIFYVNPNYASDGWRYLEAAPFDQSAGAKWGCFRTDIPGARGTRVGTGRQNTTDILAACRTPGSAAELCQRFSLDGVDGWFLPSVDELTEMYLNLKVTGACDFGDGGVADNFNYWSSSQVTADMARHLDFADNGRRWHYDDKDYPRRVRAIRAF